MFSTPTNHRCSTVSRLSVTDLQVIRSCPESAQALILLLLSAMSWLHMTAGGCRGMQDSDTRTKRWFNGSFRAALSSLQHSGHPSDRCIPSAAEHRQMAKIMTPQTSSTANQQASLRRVLQSKTSMQQSQLPLQLVCQCKRNVSAQQSWRPLHTPSMLMCIAPDAARRWPTSWWPPQQSGWPKRCAPCWPPPDHGTRCWLGSLASQAGSARECSAGAQCDVHCRWPQGSMR